MYASPWFGHVMVVVYTGQLNGGKRIGDHHRPPRGVRREPNTGDRGRTGQCL